MHRLVSLAIMVRLPLTLTGVLTKPDCIARGSRDEKLRDVLNGKRFALGHGYHIVRNLSQKEINDGLSHRDARDLEAEFFSKEPWSTTFHEYQSRFGTLNLQTFLSRKLAANALAKLPIIRQEIEQRLEQVVNEHEAIQQTPSDSAVRIVAELIASFTDNVRRELDRAFGYTEW